MGGEFFITKRREEREAVPLRHDEIEDDRIGREALAQDRERLIGGHACLYLVAGRSELHRVHIDKELVVIDEEDPLFRHIVRSFWRNSPLRRLYHTGGIEKIIEI